jgi:hypothetical protein
VLHPERILLPVRELPARTVAAVQPGASGTIDSEAGVGTQVVVADLNGDDLPDLLTAARAGAFLFLNQ